jgi:hypothetical protein
MRGVGGRFAQLRFRQALVDLRAESAVASGAAGWAMSARTISETLTRFIYAEPLDWKR